MDAVKSWYDDSYMTHGAGAQRAYPNEELCRFMGRNFFGLNLENRRNIKIMELGCGSGGNLWMIAREGFQAYGCDLAASAIEIASSEMRLKWNTQAQLNVGSMLQLPYQDMFFDAVVDVFSSYCMCRKDYLKLLDEVYRVLKPSGLLFSYFPSKKSDTYLRSTLEEQMDEDTLWKIGDLKSPYCGQDYPFRFMSGEEVSSLLHEKKMKVRYLESTGRTYNNMTEYFEWIVFEAEKI